LKNTQTLKFCC